MGLTKSCIITITLIGFSFACSNFEDSPALSLLPVKSRLAREWKVEFVTNSSSGISHSADYESWLLSIDKGGTFTNKTIYNQKELIYNGTWELTSKNQLRFEYNTNSGKVIEFYTISRLTKKEFWFKNDIQHYHYYSE